MKLRPSAQVEAFSWSNALWIGTVHAIALSLMVPFFTWQALAVFVFTHYLACMVGITFGFHRLLTHKGFVVPRWLENTVALCGTLACQGGPVSWVGAHRVHHAFSDRGEDPHDATKGFWHSHVLWVFNRRQDLDRYEDYRHYCPDISDRPFFKFLEFYMIPIQFVFGFALIGLGGVLGSAPGFDWHMATSFAVWGVFVRLMAGYHVTWFVNSAAHKWGTSPNGQNDLSKNNWWVGILAFGEGWHNNHHANPRSARHGWHWWQFDQTWIMIQTLRFLGLVKNIKIADQAKPKKHAPKQPQEAPVGVPRASAS